MLTSNSWSNWYTSRSYQDEFLNSAAILHGLFCVASPSVSNNFCNWSSFSIFNEGGNCASKHPFLSSIWSTVLIKSSTSFTAKCKPFTCVIVLETLNVNRKSSGTLSRQLTMVELLGSL